MSKPINRRGALKTIGLTGLLAPTLLRSEEFPKVELGYDSPSPRHQTFSKPLTCVIIGAGNRGWVYSRYAANFPEEMKIVGIAEPVKVRQEKFKKAYNLDIFYWILGRRCEKVSSFGDLSYFKTEHAPAGSTLRCTDGCKIESSCPYSAKRIYLTDRSWGVGHLIDLQPWEEKKVLKAIQEGPYGRCVFYCDNDVVDHQIVNMVFEDDITVAFSMEAHTSYMGRRTRVMGTEGDIVGNERELTVAKFANRKGVTYISSELAKDFAGGGHGGGDQRLVRVFLQAVYHEDESYLSSTIEASMESHYIGFKAEESRNNGGKVVML